jgi:hypothetical protein
MHFVGNDLSRKKETGDAAEVGEELRKQETGGSSSQVKRYFLIKAG